MKIGEKIKIQRKKKRMSQQKLGEIMGVSRQSVIKWEKSTSFPEIEKIIKLSEIFGVTIDYLLKDDCNLKEKRKK